MEMENEMEKRVTILEEKTKTHDKSIVALSSRVCTLEKNDARRFALEDKVDRIEVTVEKINQKLEKQAEGKYAKYWQVLFYVFTTTVGSLVGYLIGLR